MKPVEKSRENESCSGTRAEHARERALLLVDSEIAHGGAQAQFRGLGRLR